MKFKLEKLPLYLAYLVAFALGMKQMREPDIWWQILSGQWMLEHGAITRADMFSYTMQGTPWTNVKWLYEIFIAGLVNMLGPHGLVLLQAIVNVVIVLLIGKTAKFIARYFGKEARYSAIAIVALAFLAIVEYRMASRPEMFSHLFCALYLYLFWKNPDLKWRGLIWLVPLQCLWANMHEGYPVGVVMIGVFAAGSFLSYLLSKEKDALQQAMRVSITLVASILVILLNPNTIVLWKQPFEIYRQVWANKYTTELYSWSQAEYWTIQAKAHIGLLVLALVYWGVQIAGIIKSKRINPVLAGYLLLVPAMGYLSLTANRNIPFAQIVLFPSIVLLLTDVAGRLAKGNAEKQTRNAAIAVSLIAAIFYISIVNNSYYKATDSVNRFGAHVNMLHNPTGASAFIKDNKLQGPAFSDYFISSYLLWDLYPQFKSYIDLRDLDIFPASFFDNYMELHEHPEKFYSLDSQYNFNYVVVSTGQLVGMQRLLYWGKGYNLVYVDPVSAVFLKTNEVNRSVNENLSIQRLFTWPQEPDEPGWATAITKLMNPMNEYEEEDERYTSIQSAMFYNQVQNYPLAVKLLKQDLGSFDGEALGYSTLSSIYKDFAEHTPDATQKARRLDTAAMYSQMALEAE
ncbi:MAG: hypothetical protein EOP56_05605 [Sphingobacteriales bacterium]|nr:MAG: hypothetical protein EOP56_05605 [Sphingobacteriales bacterium]